MREFTFNRSIVLRSLFASMVLSAATVVHAQNINVTAANASNDAIYSVTFNNNGGGSITVLNTDQGSLHHLTSLVFLPNPNPPTFELDLLAADNSGGLIVRYPGDFHAGDPTTGTVVFPVAGEAGPQYPDGLSVDAAGDLFVVNDKEGANSLPQLWVLPSNNAGGFGSPVLLAPVQNVPNTSYGSDENLQETLVAATTINTAILPAGAINPGDLLVLTNNPSTVLLYPGNGNGSGPINPTTPSTLLTLPTGTIPGGMAFWPADNSLLITTSRGTIFQYHLTPNETPATFANGLGNGQFKIKTGLQLGKPYAYVANNNGGDILQFGGPQVGGVNDLLATVTSGVQHPEGLATTNANYAPLSTCQDQQTNGCDLLGGGNLPVITHNAPTNLSLPGDVIEDVCVVQVDPRIAQYGSCSAAAASMQYQNGLPVAQVCAGYGSTVIPNSLCGASGSNSSGFALVKTLTQAYSPPSMFPFNGAVISNDSNLSNVLPPAPANPVCNPPGTPLGTIAWAPLTGEGIVVEGNNLLETTSGCDGPNSKTYGLSLFGIGLALNTSVIAGSKACPTGGLAGFACAKYGTVLTTIQDTSNAQDPTEVETGALIAPVGPSSPINSPASLPGNFTYVTQQCIEESQAAFIKSSADYGGAALQLLTADQSVANNATNSQIFTANGDYPNPSGALRWRLQNMYYTINTRLQGNMASSGPPSPPPPPPPPTISGTPTLRVKAGTMYSFTPGAADFAGDAAPQTYLTFSIAGKPSVNASWATFNVNTGQLSGIAVKGTYPGIVITVTDGCRTASLPAFTITVY